MTRSRKGPWRKSSHSSGSSGQCTEVRLAGAVAQLSDCRYVGSRPIIDLDPAGYGGFIQGVKAGDFDT